MSHALTVAGKEFRSYFKTPVAYLFLFVFLGLIGWWFFYMPDYFAANQASMRSLWQILPWFLLLLVPAVCMKLWAEERKIGTIETLLTMPMSESSIVTGKFLAAFGLVALALGLTFPIPVMVALTAAAEVDYGPILGGYIGALLLAGAYVAICLFASALTESQIVAFIVGAVLTFVFIAIGFADVASFMPEGVAELMQNLSLTAHFRNIERGVVDTRDVVYYLSMIAVFLVLNVAAVRRR